ncbi:hypothetical protein [Nocardia sp. NPDC057668]|uniref:hypothetical protein n=1 Tax=Nocardia sp. NPDC057668 TaxID=3346202 RepID=UPI00366B0A9E
MTTRIDAGTGTGPESGAAETGAAATETGTAPAVLAKTPKSPPAPAPANGQRSISISLSTLRNAVALVLPLVVIIVLGMLYNSARSELADRDSRAADERHAEQVATDYAVGASTIDYHDTKAWLTRLKAGTTPQLSAKFDATAPQLEQILLPLQWTSKATPLSASILSEAGGIYKINAYLEVTSTSAQTPDGATTTVTYSLTIDRNAAWKITEVGGLQNAFPAK